MKATLSSRGLSFFRSVAAINPELLFRRARGEVESNHEACGLEVVQRDVAAEHVEQAVGDDEAEFVHVRAALVRRVYVNRLEEARVVFERLAPVAYLDAYAFARGGRGCDLDAAARGAAADGE